MDLTPETLRSATFRDKLRGYHPDDVDEFLESVARGLEVLLARLRDATERARAAQPPSPQPAPPQVDPDEAVRTLALAQRTADLAVREAKLEAERLVKAAEQRARSVVATAEETAVQVAEEAQAELRADLERLQAARDQLFGEVKTLGAWLEGERGRIRRALIDVADRVESVREASDAPAPKNVKVPAPPRQKQADRPARPARDATPPRGQPRTPPPAAPAARQPTPPGGQPVVKNVAPNVPRFEPAPVERPKPAPSRPDTPRSTEPPEDPVLRQAQRGMVLETPPADPERLDDDPYFAELRRAMSDNTPLGPREDDWGGADSGV